MVYNLQLWTVVLNMWLALLCRAPTALLVQLEPQDREASWDSPGREGSAACLDFLEQLYVSHLAPSLYSTASLSQLPKAPANLCWVVLADSTPLMKPEIELAHKSGKH